MQLIPFKLNNLKFHNCHLVSDFKNSKFNEFRFFYKYFINHFIFILYLLNNF